MTDTPDLGGKLGPFLAMMVVAGGMIGGVFWPVLVRDDRGFGSGPAVVSAGAVAVATATYAAPRARRARRMAGGAARPTA